MSGPAKFMQIGPTMILDTFAEAFRMPYARLVVTADDDYWLEAALRALSGYGTSVIGCDAEASVEQYLSPDDTPDGRPGAGVLIFGFSTDALAKAVPNRVGQCVMTCPTTACYDGLPANGSSGPTETIPLGKHLRFFGDGYQKSKKQAGRRYWRIPVMDGEFLVEETVSVAKGIGGGNIILQAVSQSVALAAARRASEAVGAMPGVITPFPGGVARSGSKVGSRYKGLVASTNDPLCSTRRGRVETEVVDGANCCYEIVIDGTDETTVAGAMRSAVEAAAGEGVLAIGAGNYGGKLGKFHFHLHEVMGSRKPPGDYESRSVSTEN
jgi:formylmethanofuran--tetrahydromethanopterin N-formyltransferase